MNQRRLRRLLAFLLALVLCTGLLAGCGKKDEEEPEEEPSKEIQSTRGGSGPEFSEEFDQTARFATEVNGDTLGVVFNGIQNRSTPYFTPAGSSITVDARATTESESLFDYHISLWEETGYGTTKYVEGRTLALTADGQWYTGTFSGLTAGARYKITVAYVNPRFYLSGTMAVRGLAGADADDDENGDESGGGE